jgi:poly(hydroxyalkanoate) granule-associated protein
MTKKPASKTPRRKTTEVPIPAVIKESAQQIWSAGVDAINRAQQGGNRVFETLVREGEALRDNLHQKTLKATGVTDVTSRATDTLDKLEQVFEARVARALSRLGIPTRAEIAELTKRVDELSKQLGKPAAPARKPAASVRAAAKKTSA